jgi:hypothetical protein
VYTITFEEKQNQLEFPAKAKKKLPMTVRAEMRL